MAYYAYKHVRNQIPSEFVEKFEKKYNEQNAKWHTVYEGDPNYDGDMWLMVDEYISYLKDKLYQAGIEY